MCYEVKMLILARRLGEKIVIPIGVGKNIIVTMLKHKKNQYKLGFQAPTDVSIYREELYKKIQAEKKLHYKEADQMEQRSKVFELNKNIDNNQLLNGLIEVLNKIKHLILMVHSEDFFDFDEKYIRDYFAMIEEFLDNAGEVAKALKNKL